MDVAALRLFGMVVAGWWADQRHEAVAYLVEENRILRDSRTSDGVTGRTGAEASRKRRSPREVAFH